MEAVEVWIGKQIGDYRLTALVASGGMANIFRAEHVLIGNEVAVKILNPMLSIVPDLQQHE
jgi:serine/threonine protein kinase